MCCLAFGTRYIMLARCPNRDLHRRAVDDPSLMTRPMSQRSRSMRSPDGRASALTRSRLNPRKDGNWVRTQSDFPR